MYINIVDKSGDAIAVDIAPNATVQDLKQLISEMNPSMPANRQVLIFQGMYLKNKSTITESKIVRDCIIRVVLEG